MQKKKILITVLNWGLGHAARCIPLIKALEKYRYTPVLASDGQALLLLQKEFPHLRTYELPSYNIRYSSKSNHLKWKLFLQTPSILRTITAERLTTEKIVEAENISTIISDNRFGTHSKKTINIYITHQLTVLSGNTTWLSSRIHRWYIRRFELCWIPDFSGTPNLSGILGHPKEMPENVKYIGALSRFRKKSLPVRYDYLVLLSGPEPQRTLLQDILLQAFTSSKKKILFVRGVFEDRDLKVSNTNVTVRNFMYGQELENALNSSRIVISRSGYTTLMDLAKLEKRAFFIPTPGQFEQEYLAERLQQLEISPYCKQEDFTLNLLENADKYPGLRGFSFPSHFGDLFSFLEGK